MSYHSTVFTNKDIRKHFTDEQLSKLQLISIKGKPSKFKKNCVEWKGNLVTIFGSDFIAKCALIN